MSSGFSENKGLWGYQSRGLTKPLLGRLVDLILYFPLYNGLPNPKASLFLAASAFRGHVVQASPRIRHRNPLTEKAGGNAVSHFPLFPKIDVVERFDCIIIALIISPENVRHVTAIMSKMPKFHSISSNK